MEYNLASSSLVPSINGRYLTNKHLTNFINILSNEFIIKTEGKSVLENEIYSIAIGSGKKKILLWSQMHGNESTSTKGLLDFLNFLNSNSSMATTIKSEYTLLCIPILNPDGAEAYTRVNANNIDLNRDSVAISQPESKLLRSIYTKFQPHYCYNLHDQRTIFGTEKHNLPATMSFLSPSYNITCDYNVTRLNAISVINKINRTLQRYIPNQIGRFDDAFNINCIGDYFTAQGTATILFEAGHYKNDYQRDEVRKFVFISLLSSFLKNEMDSEIDNELGYYLDIPQNSKCFFDFVYRNVKIITKEDEKIINFAAQYKEVLSNDEITFIAEIIQIDDLQNTFGHIEYDCKEQVFSSNSGILPIIQNKADFYLNNKLKVSNGLLIL